jgi:hypothetical protein
MSYYNILRKEMVKKLLHKALIKICIVLGAAVIPVSVHAAYGIREPDPEDFTVPFQGVVMSEETGRPIPGIEVVYKRRPGYAAAYTDDEGHFLLYLLEKDSYDDIRFTDIDGFENGGFFYPKRMDITREEIGNTLAVGLNRESGVPVVVRGTVISGETGNPISGIKVTVAFQSDDPSLGYIEKGFEVLSDNSGQFYLQVPKRATYHILFMDTTRRFFQPKTMSLALNKIKKPLRVGLEKIIR